MPNSNKEIALLRKDDLIRTSKWTIPFAIVPSALVVIPIEYLIYGYHLTWILLRLVCIPLAMICYLLYEINFFRQFPTIPIFIMSWYICLFQWVPITQTGYEKSFYLHAPIQFALGIALLPVS
jgi:hypothetical protein